MSEWCSKGPTLEEDIAMSNIALDMFGQANGFYQYAAQLDGNKSADELAFRRNEREFFNHQLVEQENGNFGTTMVRNFLHDVFNFLFYTELSKSKDETLSALASKSLKEVKYHLRHSRNWLIRLGDGTAVSNTKVQDALEELWMYTGELFEMDNIDIELLNRGIAVDNTALKSEWPINLCMIRRLSKRVCESKSVPPIDTKLPLAYLIVNLPSLSEVVEFSFESQVQLSSSSMHTSAPEI